MSRRGAGQAVPVQPVHRYAFVQELMRRGCISEAEALTSFKKLTGGTDVAAYQDMIRDQNREMASFNLQIRTLKFPVDKENYVGFINTHVDEPSKCATRYNHAQRDFFKAAAEVIAYDANAVDGVGSVSEIQLLNMEMARRPAAPAAGDDPAQSTQAAAPPKRLTKTEKEQALRQLVEDGWLAHHPTRHGHYSIGVRTFLELGEWLLSLDIPEDTKKAWEEIL